MKNKNWRMSESQNLVIYVASWPVSDPIGSTDLEGLIRFFTAYWTEDQNEAHASFDISSLMGLSASKRL